MNKQMIIELYLYSEKGYFESRDPWQLSTILKSGTSRHGPQTGYHISKQSFIEFSPEQKEIHARVVDIANKYNIELKIYDLAKLRFMFRAYFKKVHEIPTVIIGKKKLIGNITDEQIMNVLKINF